MPAVLYADFTSPWCYLASRRVDALTAAGVNVDWRAVQADPPVPVAGRPVDPATRRLIGQQMAVLERLLLPGELLPWTLPPVISRTEAAVSAYAEGYEAGVGADVRRLLYVAYWLQGLDIGSPEVLRKLVVGAILRGRSPSSPLRDYGYAVSVSGGPMTTSAWRRTRYWRDTWTGLSIDVLPALLVDGEPPRTGEAALKWLEKELVATGAELNPDLPDPARYPSTRVHPPMDWVSRVGGSWTHVWMPSPLKRPAVARRAA